MIFFGASTLFENFFEIQWVKPIRGQIQALTVRFCSACREAVALL